MSGFTSKKARLSQPKTKADRFAAADAAFEKGHFDTQAERVPQPKPNSRVDVSDTGVESSTTDKLAHEAVSEPDAEEFTSPKHGRLSISYSAWPADVDNIEDIKHRLYMQQRIKINSSAAVRLAVALLAKQNDQELLRLYHDWSTTTGRKG